MHIYRCHLTLHDYLFFATTERGKIAETGAFIHNYALTYALKWANSQWRNEVQHPHYPEQLQTAWEEQSAYVTPADLINGSSLINQYNTMGETYKLGKKPSAGYPDWGFIKCWRPFSTFKFYVISKNEKSFPQFIRLGKFMCKTYLHVESTQNVTREQGDCVSQPLLAWDDLRDKPIVFDLLTHSIPTRLIRQSAFDDIDFVTANFGDEKINIPLNMGYMSTPDKATVKAFKKCPNCKNALNSLGGYLCNTL